MISCTKKKPEQFVCDMIIYFVRQVKNGIPTCSHNGVKKQIDLAANSGDFTGKEGQEFLFYPDDSMSLKAKRVLVVGLGKKDLSRETFRKAGGVASRQALQGKAGTLLVVVPVELAFQAGDMAECLAEGLVLGSYQFLKYKKEDEGEKPGKIAKISFYSPKHATAVRRGMHQGLISGRCGNQVRNMANEPGNLWTAVDFALYAKSLALKPRLSCKVLGEKELKRLKMGGLLGVNQGSSQPARLVILEYRTGKKVPTLLLVGKGLTFDSGGISLKPGKGMDRMKYDMCGGAAVMAAMEGVAEEQPENVDVVCIVPSTDNMPGPSALKPGDVITIYGGKTVEVLNTDAEGRLILADALAYGVEKFKPDAVVDLATLTGAVVVGLGHHRTGLLTNDDDLSSSLLAAGERSGEPLWRLPLGREYTKQLESNVADLKNIGGPAGGTITAAAFLEEFVGDAVWAHLDIAGTAWDFTEKSYVPKGASGIGARTLLELIRAWK